MAAMLETPSRVWRRIEAAEGREMPSLPSLPAFDDSVDEEFESTDETSDSIHDSPPAHSPIHSTPALSSHTVTSTIRAPSSTSSTARFAHSIASRSTKSALSVSRGSAAKQTHEESFDLSAIPSLPDARIHDGGDSDIRSSDQETEDSSHADVYPPSDFGDGVGDLDGDLDISDALQSVSRPNSPGVNDASTPQKKYDYSVSLRSEKQASPFDKMRHVSFRRPLSRTRTPSLSRTTPSPSSSSSHSTPQSNRSITYSQSATASPLVALSVPLPRSPTASPSTGEQLQGESVLEVQTSHETQPDVDDDMIHDRTEVTGNLPPASDTSEQDRESHREPTFSSEEAPSQSDHDENRAMRSPTPLSVAFSSPAPSAMLTPTPAFQPRPRTRFNAPLATVTPQQHLQRLAPGDTAESADGTMPEDEQEDPATPYAHKRSFLLSVIHSTARPRLKYPTPHPHRDGEERQAQMPATPGVNLRTAFAGVTPRPRVRPRLSHPLTQAWAPSDADSGSGSESASGSAAGTQSPYDSAMERASFLSTASSHDLTTHARANASFDPVLGLGERGHGVGRFNAGKLNSYLHGLNRRLEEENETLVLRLRVYEDKYGKEGDGEPSSTAVPQQGQGRRISGGGRRVSAGPGIGLGDVAEDVAEAWTEEKAALEEIVEELKEELKQCTLEKEQAEGALLEEKSERARDKERWRDRMGEVEKGVEGIVRDLEQKLQEAQQMATAAGHEKMEAIKEADKRLAAAKAEKEVLVERLKKAEDALEGGRELGAELNSANERVAQVMGDLRNANTQIKELEDEVMGADERIDELEKALREGKQLNSGLDEELQNKSDQLADALQRVKTLDEELQRARHELRDIKDYAEQADADAGVAVERMEGLEERLIQAQEKIEALTASAGQDKDKIVRLSDDANKASELARQMEEALEAAEAKMLADEQELVALKAKITALERTAERVQEQSRSKVDPSQSNIAKEWQVEIEALEAELDDAHREIARLNTLISQSPARKAMERAKDSKIEILEKEREELMERMKLLKGHSIMSGTPGKVMNTSGFSPMHRQLLSIRSPKTPGGPLRELSWLQNSVHDPTVSPLIAEISRLQQELDRANESIDDKLDKLEDAGLGVVGLTRQLDDARARIVTLEDEIARLSRREERRYHRLQRARCLKCHSKVDLRNLHRAAIGDESSLLEVSNLSLPSDPPTPPTKTSEALRRNLQAVNSQLASMKKAWDEEKRQLLGEKAVLQDATNRLNMQVRDANYKLTETERVGERVRASVQEELDNAKRAIDDLEIELKSERMRLRTLTTEQSRVRREKEEVVFQLRRTESDMADVKERLQRIKQENHQMEADLRTNANVEQKARLLEKKVSENAETMEQLRQERSLLAADHKELQNRYSKVSDHMSKLRDEYAASQTSHDNRRHQLDLHLLEIEDLRRALSEKDDELLRAESEKNCMEAEKNDVARTVAALEEDLRRVRRDAEAFGRDLKLLRTQKDRLEEESKQEKAKAERAHKQSQTQIRVLKEELEGQRDKAKTITEQFKNHVCVADERQLAAMKLQHNKECKGLIVQIRYLKAKFTRESTLRCDLGYQKRYLLVLLARLERNEQKILASIAKIGFPGAEPPALISKSRTLKSVALSIVFITRSKRASDSWREQSASKEAIAAALQEVRRQRATRSVES
ncbi:hypothetical protein AcW1_006527 [Taiwanofungus camphoratus]|nr:hypothetical protein AcW1_006527 [Antrodia cinnamomea]